MSKRITGMQRYEHGFRDKKKSIKKNGKKSGKKKKNYISKVEESLNL